MNHAPSHAHCLAIRELLGIAPRAAVEIAIEADLDLAETYHTLAWMYDRREARIARAPKTGLVQGWVQGVAA